ncbi:MAG: choice-of-anchor M domain-containing protein [Verrucomicrobiota bacterium]
MPPPPHRWSWWPVFLLLLTVSGRAFPQGAVRFTNQHLDLRITFTPAAEPGGSPRLSLVVRNSDAGLNLASTNAVLVIPESARTEIPPGFEPLGPAGSSLWILPQSQNPDLIYLGFSAEGIAPGLLEPAVTLRLVQLTGPGDFVLWQADGLGGLAIPIQSRDGLSDADQLGLFVGSHAHFNAGFSASGSHTLGFEAEARLSGTTNRLRSAVVPVRFDVLPLPDRPLLPARLGLPVVRADGGLEVPVIELVPGRRYALEGSADLQAWQVLDAWPADTNSLTRVLPAPLEVHRSLRVRTLPD